MLLLQRWALVLLLLTRLVIGEVGHAMPHGDHARGGEHDVKTMLQEAAADCAEHEAEGAGANEQTAPGAAEPETSDAHDCCESGDCNCPCLHVPCAALDARAATRLTPDAHRRFDGAHGLPLQRLSGLFRPPA